MAKSFTFKQFHIDAKQCGMPVSTDAVLLGAWVKLKNVSRILDLGTGTGLLALMCAQRNQIAKIVAIDIDANAVKACSDNFANSPWSRRLSASLISAQQFVAQQQKFEMIICNPPYFNSGETATSQSRAIARHSHTLPHQELITSCVKLLEDEGEVNFVLPVEEGKALIKLAEQSHLQLQRYTEIKTTAKKAVSRLLLCFKKSQKVVNLQRESLLINENKGYSAEFISLTKEFYLNL